MNKIGLLGGTFNPIHRGHLRIAERVANVLGLKKVIFIPSAHPPHKKESNLPSPQDRFEMVNLAIKNNPCFSISDIELKRKGKSWTIDTVRIIKKLYPESQIYFIIGADTVPEIPTWKNYKKLLKSCRFVVVNRPGYTDAEYPDYTKNFIKVKMRGVDIASTEIRERIKNGKTIKALVPVKVEKYIKEKGIYK
ncbi:nicotinate (nicotinamide) nucleotide adenylyltransferase [Candidatus Desantisbacteria bacterium CG1_02_38_46]|uniref:Probable nicotinate-nucleotide adenylyltransferase n=3 Tax=unclassified Candidatus Desantisiibacteriota TaxID=3106372 RepID=A0A2H9PC33_9BACT|nr:MAG: nicotinate (nicotinamide) nucleotide adenylyltransferase [Candidatus Desantisbacteria bacterium CG1_02_38_46]PIU50982.1 MAG: nicotinic acid mononucleotide adenylyltransferase [Candidatus Desantisbacteria bacterium CG07_land_8_20_14_0_80_39_15]PIZ16578.1 MAG: nicotinic acid mononucleotide adenylyltransferase [Candidatus Desantisbacteria bacterium CG_4_10_14_0_8_um_filter_39_17]